MLTAATAVMLLGWAQRRASLPKRSASVNTACSRLCLITRSKRITREPHLPQKVFQTLLQEQEHRELVLRWEGQSKFPEACSSIDDRTVEGARILSSIKMLTLLCTGSCRITSLPCLLWNINYMLQDGASQATYTDCIQVPPFKLLPETFQGEVWVWITAKRKLH